MGDEIDRIDFFLDVMCPWAYQGSKWIREVRDQTGLDITWRFFSLEEINLVPGKKHPWERDWSYGWSQMRIGALLRRQGQEAVDSWYRTVGRAFFEDGVPTHVPEVHAEVLDSLGYDGAATVEAGLADPTTAEEVRADHEWAVNEKGAHGVPTLVFPGGHAVFGPVVTPAPVGEAAVRLWDLTVGWTEFPHLFEMRQPKTPAHLAHIGREFTTYLQARAWRTIENPAP